MGLFKKKNKDSGEDFILDFGGEEASVSNSNANGDEELNITLWDDRKPHHRPSHAMTVSEILGNFGEEETGLEAPPAAEEMPQQEQVPAEEPKAEAPQTEVAESEAVSTPVKEESEPIKIEVPNQEDSAAVKAEALIERLKQQIAEENEQTQENEISAPKEAEALEETPKADSVKEVPVAEAKPEIAAENTPAVPEETPKKEAKLSPTAQALYDKMMAERAKMQSSLKRPTPPVQADPTPAATDLEKPMPESDTAEVTTETEKNTEPLLDFHSDDVTLTSDIIPTAALELGKSESVADAIFDSLNESFKKENPLSRKMEQSADSLLSKCKSYVNPAYDIDVSNKSIDDIIQSAEKGARERLSNLYEIHETEPATDLRHTGEFSPFLQHSTDGLKGNTISIPVKIQDETNSGAVISSSAGDIKNFQYSFADGENDPDTDSTQVIDLPSSSGGHVTDPIKAQVMRMHLQSLTEEEEPQEDVPLKFRGADEAEIPDTDVSNFDTHPEVDDYRTIADKESVHTDFIAQRLSIIARLIPTAVICLVLFFIDVIFKDSITAASTATYTLLNIILFLGAMLINFKTLKGFAGIVGGTADMDSPAALSSFAVLFYTLMAAIMGRVDSVPALAPVATLILCFNLLGKLSILKRIRRGFDVIANEQTKNAITFVEDKYSASVMANGEVIGEALICQGKKTKNINDYLKNSFMEDAYEKKLPPILIFTLISASVLALAAFFANGSVLAAVAAFAAVCCVGSPISGIFSCNAPLSLLSKKLKGYGAMLSGYAAGEAIANANAVAFDAADLFPKGTIKLYNMQVLESGAVDKYIASAAAILTSAGSPLAPIFEEILETNNEKMPEADSIKYENNMGLSGWIGDHRIFIGNRTLLEGHGIKTPSLELDKKVLRQGFFPVYLAVDQQLCALFIVGYEADEEITYELRSLCNTGVTMFVNSNDPNISDEMLCDYFGLYPDSIKVMNTTGTAAYKNVGSYRESISATACYSNNICGLLATVSGSIRLKSIITTLIVIQFILIALGIAVSGYYIFTVGILKLSTLLLPLFHLAGALITSLVAHLKQP